MTLCKIKAFSHKKLSINLFSIDIFGKLRYTFGRFSDSYKNEFAEFLNRRSVKAHGNPSQE